MSNARSSVAKYLLVIAIGVSLAGVFALRRGGDRNRLFITASEVWQAYWPSVQGKLWVKNTGPFLQRIGLIGPGVVEIEPGIKLKLDPEDYLGKTLLMTGVWEPDTWQVIEKHLRPGGTFVDVGAHVGYYSLKTAKLVGPQGHVIAIEPNPSIVEELRENIQSSGVADRVSVQPVACFERRTKLEFFVSPEADTSQSSLSRENASVKGQARSITVDAVPLDEIIDSLHLARVDVIKMDIEGAELTALRGATRTIAHFRPTLVLEIIDHHLRNMGASEQELIAFLEELGYERDQTLVRNVSWSPK